VDDLEVAGGQVGVVGDPGSWISVAEVAGWPTWSPTAARGIEPGLEATRFYDRSAAPSRPARRWPP